MLWGIDLGGTKIEGVVLDPEYSGMEPVCRIRIDTQQEHGYEHIVGRIAQLVALMSCEVGRSPDQIGIGTPGALDPQTGVMKNCNTTCLNGRPLPADLNTTLGLPVRVANDANCFALAEAMYGAGKGAEVVFGVIMGTGVGAGIVVNGQVLDGAQGIAGEWGHNELEPGGERCYCGRVGCVETVISGPGLERFYFARSGVRKTLKEIVSSTDDSALQTLERLYSMFGKAIARVINILDPHVIVLGGGVGNVEDLGTRGAVAAAPFVFNPLVETAFRRPLLGDSAGVFGAALLASGSSARCRES